MRCKINFKFIRKMINGLLSLWTMGSLDESLASNSRGPIKCVSLRNRPFQARPLLVHIHSNETLFIC